MYIYIYIYIYIIRFAYEIRTHQQKWVDEDDERLKNYPQSVCGRMSWNIRRCADIWCQVRSWGCQSIVVDDLSSEEPCSRWLRVDRRRSWDRKASDKLYWNSAYTLISANLIRMPVAWFRSGAALCSRHECALSQVGTNKTPLSLYIHMAYKQTMSK